MASRLDRPAEQLARAERVERYLLDRQRAHTRACPERTVDLDGPCQTCAAYLWLVSQATYDRLISADLLAV